jgi:hypothetical protein
VCEQRDFAVHTTLVQIVNYNNPISHSIWTIIIFRLLLFFSLSPWGAKVYKSLLCPLIWATRSMFSW